MSNLCVSCKEPLNYPSGDGCAAMTRHRPTGIFHISYVVEHEDGSATYSFDIDKDTQQGLCKIGLEFVLYCAAHELDLQYVFDNLERLRQQNE